MKENRFEVGDFVIVRELDDLLSEYEEDFSGGDIITPYCTFVPPMRRHCGKIREITAVYRIEDHVFYNISDDSMNWNFDEETLRSAEEEVVVEVDSLSVHYEDLF